MRHRDRTPRPEPWTLRAAIRQTPKGWEWTIEQYSPFADGWRRWSYGDDDIEATETAARTAATTFRRAIEQRRADANIPWTVIE